VTWGFTFFIEVLLKILFGVVRKIPIVTDGVRFVPILRLRVIEAELDAGFLRRVGELFQRVALEWRRIVDVVLGRLRTVHGEPIVMLRRDDDVFHPGILCEANYLVGVEFYRVELRRELLVLVHRDLRTIHDPFA
jgi:hypothetical protein